MRQQQAVSYMCYLELSLARHNFSQIELFTILTEFTHHHAVQNKVTVANVNSTKI